MENVQEQLAALRRRIARIDRKYSQGEPPRVTTRRSATRMLPVEDLLSGEVVRTSRGSHFETERVWERHRRHGSVGIGDLADLPEDLLDALSGGNIPGASPARWAFLDTETTGLGASACAFLVGVGSIGPDGFRLRQFFMRDYSEEASVLASLSAYLARFTVLITYNGKAFDQPLLETRYRCCCAKHPFQGLEHLDLLFGARRLWKLRLESCRLADLETQILGVEREGDLPGEMIPYYYFDYLRTQEAFRLVPIFHHNAIDILSLACLTAIVPLAFRAPEDVHFRHGSDLIGLARWVLQSGRPDQALVLFRRAVELGLPDELLFRTLWETAALERRYGSADAALATLLDLTVSRNAFRSRAYEELAKHAEHKLRDYERALELTRAALRLEDSPQTRRREERLVRRIGRGQAGRPAPRLAG